MRRLSPVDIRQHVKAMWYKGGVGVILVIVALLITGKGTGKLYKSF